MNTALENALINGYCFFAGRYGNFCDLDIKKASVELANQARIQGLSQRHISPTELMDRFYRSAPTTLFSGTGFMNTSQIARLTVEVLGRHLYSFIDD